VSDPAAALRSRIVGTASPEFSARHELPGQAAAVLLGLVDQPAGPGILLTVRAAHLPHHPGQISFPGGRLQPGEPPDAAALREAEEEVALPQSQVTLLGRLPPQLTGTGFLVTPVVGWIAPGFVPRPDPAEVESAFIVPLDHLRLPANRGQTTRLRWDTELRSEEFYFERFLIWGATAAILNHFLEIIDD
jgi:8-oxo-dGTP pyrophosphatase MutT (NUDIX family)